MEKRIEQLKIVLHILEEIINDLPDQKHQTVTTMILICKDIEEVIEDLKNEL